jgi:hypothetical protein
MEFSQHVEIDFDLCGREALLSADIDGYFEHGKYSGKPEDCYPDEGDFEFSNVVISWMTVDGYHEVEEGGRHYDKIEKLVDWEIIIEKAWDEVNV